MHLRLYAIMDDWVIANDEELVMTMLKQDDDDFNTSLWMIVTRHEWPPTLSMADIKVKFGRNSESDNLPGRPVSVSVCGMC